MEGTRAVNMQQENAKQQLTELTIIRKAILAYISVSLDEDEIKKFTEAFNKAEDTGLHQDA